VETAFLLVVVALAAGVQAVSGFGFALLAVPILAIAVDLRHAVVVVTIVATVSTAVQWWESRAVPVGPLARRLLVSSVVGLPLGLWALVALDARMMKALLGISVLSGVAMLAWRGTAAAVKGVAERHRWDLAAGVASGVLATATSTNGPPLVFLLRVRGADPASFRAVLNRVFTVTGVASLALFAAVGVVRATDLVAAVLAVPVMLAAVWLGIRARPLVAEATFRRLTLVLLALSGASALVSALLG
jgi:uncharacterized membrane protein YfcA